MSTKLRRLFTVAIALAAFTACDDGTDPVAMGTIEVAAYVDVDASNDFNGPDDPIQGATVTLTPTGGGDPQTSTTGASGIATFDVDVGTYTASIELPATMTGVTLSSASTPSVTAQEDATASTEFRYTYVPGSISGHVYLEAAAGDGLLFDYEDGDVVVPFLTVTLSQGGTDLASTETDAEGEYTFNGQLPGDYTVTVDVPPYLTDGDESKDVTVTAAEDATLDFGFSAQATHTIQEARAAEDGTMVAVIGVAITGTTGDNAVLSGSSFYLQDASGISIYLNNVDAPVMLGDEVLIYGERGAFNDEVQLTTFAALNLGPGTLPDPMAVEVSEINSGEYQGRLGVVHNLYIAEVEMEGGEPTGDVFARDLHTAEELLIYVDRDAGIDVAATFEEGGIYDVSGVVARYQDIFELKPRMPADVVEATEPGTTLADVRAAAEGTSFTITGVVTEDGTLEGNGFYMEDATAGIFVYTSFGGLPDLSIGDVVTVTGDRAQFFDIAQIGGDVTVTATGQSITPVPTTTTAAGLNTGDYQGRLVIMRDVVVDRVEGSNVIVTDDSGEEAVVRIDGDSGVSAAGFVVGETYSITGVVTNFGGTEQLKPRFPDDVEGVVQVEPLTTIAEARAAEDGYPVELTGVVTVTNGPDAMIDYRNAYLQDGTGGILIRMPTDSVVELGDSITVTGTTGTFVQERQINVDASGITRHGAGTVPDARVVTPAEIEAGSYQGELAKLEGVEVTEIDGGEVTVTDGTNTTIVYVDSDTDIDTGATFSVGSSYDIVGVVSRYNTTFELKPRQQSDIVAN